MTNVINIYDRDVKTMEREMEKERSGNGGGKREREREREGEGEGEGERLYCKSLTLVTVLKLGVKAI